MQSELGVGLALSSGGARGFAHIGVLKVLDAHHIPIAGIVGSSMGGLIGALYCTGYNGDMIEELSLEIRRSHWMDFSVSRMGLMSGKKIEGLINLLTRGRRFEDCRPPLKMVAVDIQSGNEVILERGPLYRGVRATISIPGIFNPVIQDGQILVDGGVLNRVPVNLLRIPHAGVVAVDVGVDLASEVSSVFDVLFQTFDIMAREIRKSQPIVADLLIEPHVANIRDAHPSRIREFIQAGESACEEQLPAIFDLLSHSRKEGCHA